MGSGKSHGLEVMKVWQSLNSKGFHTIPLVRPIPDLIAIKGDNLRVFAVEVEMPYKNQTQHDDKMKLYKGASWFDDVMLIVPERRMETGKNGVSHLVVPAEMDSKGRVVIPYHLRDILGLREGDSVVFNLENGKVTIGKT
jgi:AbrB family looped-hinge helix DNA binding protein